MILIDYFVLGLYFAVILGIGFYSSKNKDNTSQYFLANRNLGWFVIGASLFASNIGQDFNLNSLSLSSNMTNANPKRIMLYVNQGGTSGGHGGALHIQNAEGFLEFSSEI